MKKRICLLLVMLLLFSMTACDAQTEDGQGKNPPAPETSAQDQIEAEGEKSSSEDKVYEGALVPGEVSSQEQTVPVEDVPAVELKPFELSIEEGVLFISYPDGEMDENVDYYEVCINQISLWERISGTELDLNAYDLSAVEQFFVEVYAVREEGSVSMCASFTYDVPQPEIPMAPAVSLTAVEDTLILTIDPVAGAEGYEIFINGVCAGNVSEPTYTIRGYQLEVGKAEVYVCAYNRSGSSGPSETLFTGKLANPQYHATGTGVELLWGDVENAQGYIIYGDDGAYLATIGLGGSYDFSTIYTTEGFYFPSIQAYADGWMSSEKCGIPVMIGNAGGPIGN